MWFVSLLWQILEICLELYNGSFSFASIPTVVRLWTLNETKQPALPPLSVATFSVRLPCNAHLYKPDQEELQTAQCCRGLPSDPDAEKPKRNCLNTSRKIEFVYWFMGTLVLVSINRKGWATWEGCVCLFLSPRHIFEWCGLPLPTLPLRFLKRPVHQRLRPSPKVVPPGRKAEIVILSRPGGPFLSRCVTEFDWLDGTLIYKGMRQWKTNIV